MKKFFLSMVLLLVTIAMAVIESNSAAGMPTIVKIDTPTSLIAICDLVFLAVGVWIWINATSYKQVLWVVVGAVILTAFMIYGVQFMYCLWDFFTDLKPDGGQILPAAAVAVYIVLIYAIAIYTFLHVYVGISLATE